MASLGGGLAGTVTVVVGLPLVSAAVTSCPPSMVVDAVLPLALAMHVLDTLLAVNGPAYTQLVVPGHEPAGWLAGWMVLELVTVPELTVPCVLTTTGPELKRVAGPYATFSEVSEAVIGAGEPPAGSVTVGAGP